MIYGIGTKPHIPEGMPENLVKYLGTTFDDYEIDNRFNILMDDKTKEKIIKFAYDNGYNSAFPLISKYKNYNVVYMTDTSVPHSKYEGLPFYMVWNEEEMRAAETEEIWEILKLD